MIKGIKALGMNMEAIKGNGMIYEMNKEYIHGDGVRCRHSGYHYFDSIRDIMTLYNLNESRLFECELNGDVFDHDNIVHCTNKIKLVREINKEEIKKYIEDNLEELVNDRDWDVRREVARQGYGLDILVNDKDCDVRLEVAKHGYCLDKLVNDEDCDVRLEVARQGYGLDILVNDWHCYVREEVAKQGYGLDILINDKDWKVRMEVARQGYCLDILINDEDWNVRLEVARQGYKLIKLSFDKNKIIKNEARNKLCLSIKEKLISLFR